MSISLLEKIMKPKSQSERTELTPQLKDNLRLVKSIDDCMIVFEKAAISDCDILNPAAIAPLHQFCVEMRESGMALEPNLIGRAASRRLSDYQERAKASKLFSQTDTDFRYLFQSGDEKRDRKDFAGSEYSYWRSLQLYPCHVDANVQYAHSLKEQSKFADALVRYLDAHSLGAPLNQIEEHCEFAAEMIGLKEPANKRLKSRAVALLSADVINLHDLCVGSKPHMMYVAQALISYDHISGVLGALIETDAFRNSNRNLLRLIAEQGI